MIKVIDYGLGNIHAFLNVYKRIGIPAARASIAADLDGATHVILPGVGSFDHAMTLFNASGFREALERRISRQDIRLLGVCVGMQMLAEKSEEGILPGLGWIGGTVKKFESGNSGSSLRLPHMGIPIFLMQQNPRACLPLPIMVVRLTAQLAMGLSTGFSSIRRKAIIGARPF